MATLPTQVQAGDVISATLMNRILEEIASLQLQINALSGQTVTLGPVEIIRLNKDSITMGEELQVYGRNLAVANLVYVTIGGVPVTSFKEDRSNSSLLVFDVPAIIGITDPGALVTLEIRNNQGGPARAPVFVMPAAPTQLNANFGFSVTPPTAAIQPSGTGVYTFLISALTSAAETYTVNAIIDGGWSAQASPTELTIPKSLTSATSRTVSVTVTAPATGSATLKLELVPKNFPGPSYFSQNVPVAVGSTGQGSNPDFTLTSTSVVPGAAFASGKIKCTAGQTRTVKPNVALAKPGTYLITAAVTAPWTAVVQNSPNPVTTTVTGSAVIALVELKGPSSGLSTGTTGKLTITYARQTAPTDTASFEYDVVAE